MDMLILALDSAWQVLVVGLLLGAGLPAVFALGIRSLAYGTHRSASSGPGPHPIGRVGAGLAFTVVLLAVALGITFVVATGLGRELSFEHVYPTLVAED